MELASLVINLSKLTLCVESILDNSTLKCYPVAVGKSNTPTPVGTFEVKKVIPNPILLGYSQEIIGGGILGTWAICLEKTNNSAREICIHGTNNPSSISTRASKGCIRLYNSDVNEIVNSYLFNQVKIY